MVQWLQGYFVGQFWVYVQVYEIVGFGMGGMVFWQVMIGLVYYLDGGDIDGLFEQGVEEVVVFQGSYNGI